MISVVLSAESSRDLIQRVTTLRQSVDFGIGLYLAKSSFLNTVYVFETFGIDWIRSTVHGRFREADLRSGEDQVRNHVSVDRAVIRLDDGRYGPYAAIDPETNESHRSKVVTRTNVVRTVLRRIARETPQRWRSAFDRRFDVAERRLPSPRPRFRR